MSCSDLGLGREEGRGGGREGGRAEWREVGKNTTMLQGDRRRTDEQELTRDEREIEKELTRRLHCPCLRGKEFT